MISPQRAPTPLLAHSPALNLRVCTYWVLGRDNLRASSPACWALSCQPCRWLSGTDRNAVLGPETPSLLLGEDQAQTSLSDGNEFWGLSPVLWDPRGT